MLQKDRNVMDIDLDQLQPTQIHRLTTKDAEIEKAALPIVMILQILGRAAVRVRVVRGKVEWSL